MSLTEQGVSTTTERNSFKFEVYQPVGSKTTKVQWDYRDASGELHTGIACDLNYAKAAASAFGYCP